MDPGRTDRFLCFCKLADRRFSRPVQGDRYCMSLTFLFCRETACCLFSKGVHETALHSSKDRLCDIAHLEVVARCCAAKTAKTPLQQPKDQMNMFSCCLSFCFLLCFLLSFFFVSCYLVLSPATFYVSLQP